MEDHLLSNSRQTILKILQDENVEKHFSININFIELFDIDTRLGNELLKDPEEALEELDNWLLHVQDIIFQESVEKTKLKFKDNVHARVYGLPSCPELHRIVFPRNEDLESFLQITGTVVKTRDPKMLEYQRSYRCSKCKYIQMMKADYDQKYVIYPPKKCLNPESCQGKNFVNNGTLNVENCKDYQEIKIQEQTSNLNSTMPSSLWVTLEDDLVDLCKPGDDVTICGIVKRRWGPLIPGKTIDVELAFKANHIQVHNGNTAPIIITSEMEDQFFTFWKKYEDSPLEGRDIILKSFCPKLYGMYLVKLAVAIVLAGGSIKSGLQSEIQKRSESHILLVGDPGTGKSQLLRYSSKIIARSVSTTGVGTTSAGLTVAAIIEDGQWQLEAGALVLADGGICCIDEFNSMKSNDRASIHEAMEQQTISVAKAGIHCKLRTRCSILAATNPKGGHLDSFQSLSLNLAIPSPLLSRFDIVLMLKDTYKHEWDSKIAKHILSGKSFNATNKIDECLWSLEMLQQYFIVIKTMNPLLSCKADQILAAYYRLQRQASTRNKSRTTVRLLESLIRLSQGHAKLMFHTEVGVMDAVFAIIVSESSMHGECAVLTLDPLNVLETFPVNPMKSYANLSSTILTQLGLNEILESEIDFLRSKCLVDVGSGDTEEIPNRSGISDIDYNSSHCKTTNVLELNHTEQDKHVVDSSLKINKPDVSINTDKFINRTSSEHKLNRSQLIVEDTKNDKVTPNSSNIRLNSYVVNDSTINKRLSDGCFNKFQKIIDNKRKNCDNESNDVNMLNLIKSVNDDFDLNFLKDDEGNGFVESQKTKLKNVHKKFKFKPKEKIQSNSECIQTVSNANQLTKGEITHEKKSTKKIDSYHFNAEFNHMSVDTKAHVLNTTNQKQNENLSNIERILPKKLSKQCSDLNDSVNDGFSEIETKDIHDRKNSKSETIKTPVKESLKSRFAFVPRNPPESDVPEENAVFSMFESEDQNLDFLNFDI